MVVIAEHLDNPITTHEIAQELNVSETHLSKVLQRLVREGLIRSARGPRGGFRLAKEAKDICLMDVYEAIEGTLPDEHCLFHGKPCTREYCIMGGVMVKVNNTIRQYMRKTKLAKFANAMEGG
jgi:Rrf2 family nitric oxide-sensitive transcriptional repressor